jgi:hypothetical protein
VKVNNVEVCGVLDQIEKFPMFKDFVDFLEISFPGLVQKCPYKGVSIFDFISKFQFSQIFSDSKRNSE